MTHETILAEYRDGVALITLNRPARKNAFNDTQYDELRAALAAARADDSVRVVTVTGAAGAFSAGQDLSEFGDATKFTGFVDELSTLDKPVIAAVNGVAVGVGVTMLLHCDLIYVAESARLRVPFVSLGIVPEAGSTLLLPLSIGPQRAAELFYTARWVSAREAVELGLAVAALPDAELTESVRARADEIAAQPLATLRETKRLLLATRDEALKAARRREDTVQATRIGSPEVIEAIQAFREKRPPRFNR